MKQGTITGISGPVIDVRFPEGQLPAIYDAVRLEGGQGTVTAEVVQELAAVNVNGLTPMDAMNLLYTLQKKAQEVVQHGTD